MTSKQGSDSGGRKPMGGGGQLLVDIYTEN